MGTPGGAPDFACAPAPASTQGNVERREDRLEEMLTRIEKRSATLASLGGRMVAPEEQEEEECDKQETKGLLEQIEEREKFSFNDILSMMAKNKGKKKKSEKERQMKDTEKLKSSDLLTMRLELKQEEFQSKRDGVERRGREVEGVLRRNKERVGRAFTLTLTRTPTSSSPLISTSIPTLDPTTSPTPTPGRESGEEMSGWKEKAGKTGGRI